LHNGAGTIVAENDDMVIGSNRDSLLVFTPTSSGNYYINVGGYGDEYAGSYQVRVVVPVNGVHLATAAAEPFFGAAGSNTVSYANAPAVFGGTGVAVSLVAPAKNTGFAAGDTYNSIENLIGSSFNDKLTGDNGNNILEGGAGADVLAGGYGSDTVSYAGSTTGVVADLTSIRNNTGHAAGDTYVNIENLAGSSLNDALTGNKFANAIQGGAGDDTLCGSKGLDTLFGQLGNDVFRFMTAKDGVDTIGDFAAGQDAIGIAKSGFKINASVSLGTGDAFDFALHYFVSGPGNAQITAQNPAGVLATEAGHGQFLFNQTTDQLYWDQDGAGRKAAVLIAQFATPVDLHASDFILS
jgi:serralysin